MKAGDVSQLNDLALFALNISKCKDKILNRSDYLIV